MTVQITLGHERRVVKTRKMLELEQERGEPIDELIIKAYNQYGAKETCTILGITPVTLRNWCRNLGIVSFYGVAKRATLDELGLSVKPKQKPNDEE